MDANNRGGIGLGPKTTVSLLPRLSLLVQLLSLDKAGEISHLISFVTLESAGRFKESHCLSLCFETLHRFRVDWFALALSAMYLEVYGEIGTLKFIVVIPWHMSLGRASVLRLGEHFCHPESKHFGLTEMPHKIRLPMRRIDEHDGPRPLTVDLRSLRK